MHLPDKMQHSVHGGCHGDLCVCLFLHMGLLLGHFPQHITQPVDSHWQLLNRGCRIGQADEGAPSGGVWPATVSNSTCQPPPELKITLTTRQAVLMVSRTNACHGPCKHLALCMLHKRSGSDCKCLLLCDLVTLQYSRAKGPTSMCTIAVWPGRQQS